VRQQHRLEPRGGQIHAQRPPVVAAHVAELHVGCAPQPLMSGHRDHEAAAGPEDARGLLQRGDRIVQVLDHVEEAHHLGRAASKRHLVNGRAQRVHAVSASLCRERLVALEHRDVVRRPPQHRRDPAGSAPEVDQPPLRCGRRGRPTQRGGHERRLAPEPPVRAIGPGQESGIGVIEHLGRPGSR